MHKPKHYIAVISLICACFLMLTTTVLPHHHHDDGHICLVFGNVSDIDSGHTDDTSGCDDDCLMKLGAVQDASLIGHSLKIALHPVVWIAVLWDAAAVPDIEEHKVCSPFVYIEHPCKCIVCTLCGLRAPPMA